MYKSGRSWASVCLP
ncbi:hypothetical protein FOY51_06350 [Antrihabitans cavernicola]|uniref:Uncharacterized protein n=1 Tax=Antrihabitans cavernicola TaxID=2495913 RepID=A0A5A7SI26_9NOCA|nr:hypothetical protein FOY51_06350 [Spelaeibacter cavernicola]